MKKQNLLTLDVEADGPCPGIYNMVSFALVDVHDQSSFFYGEVAPLTNNWIPEALKVSGYTREEHENFSPYHEVIQSLFEWVETKYSGRITVISDNPAFDWQFLNYYVHRYMVDHPNETVFTRNPFGFSARRIGDLNAGLTRDFTNTAGWKKHTKQKHTHNALDDARKMAEGVRYLLKQF